VKFHWSSRRPVSQNAGSLLSKGRGDGSSLSRRRPSCGGDRLAGRLDAATDCKRSKNFQELLAGSAPSAEQPSARRSDALDDTSGSTPRRQPKHAYTPLETMDRSSRYAGAPCRGLRPRLSVSIQFRSSLRKFTILLRWIHFGEITPKPGLCHGNSLKVEEYHRISYQLDSLSGGLTAVTCADHIGQTKRTKDENTENDVTSRPTDT
jgi:hypothetical protein